MSPFLLDPFQDAVAVLELLAAAARARLIASDLRRRAHGTLRLGRRRQWRRSAARAGWRGLRLLAGRATELRQRRGLGVLHLQRAIEPRTARLFLALDLLRALHLHVER